MLENVNSERSENSGNKQIKVKVWRKELKGKKTIFPNSLMYK